MASSFRLSSKLRVLKSIPSSCPTNLSCNPNLTSSNFSKYPANLVPFSCLSMTPVSRKLFINGSSLGFLLMLSVTVRSIRLANSITLLILRLARKVSSCTSLPVTLDGTIFAVNLCNIVGSSPSKVCSSIFSALLLSAALTVSLTTLRTSGFDCIGPAKSTASCSVILPDAMSASISSELLPKNFLKD